MARRGLIQLPPNSERVIDADEEVFIIYSELQTKSSTSSGDNPRGLGYVDSHKDVLEVKFELKGVVPAVEPTNGSNRQRHKSRKAAVPVDQSIEIELLQDKTALRSRKGDTGSVLWRASMDFGQLVLQQYHSNMSESLLDRGTLESQHILELGSGTGLLGIAFSPLVRQYTATDIGSLIPLIRKNVALNFPGWPNCPSNAPGSNISVEELDWKVLESSSSSQRSRNFSFEPVDLLLVVDCIYHPSLLPSFVSAIDYLTTAGRTAVLVVSELRAEDVMREFLEIWLSKAGWEIWRVPNLLENHYVVWMGWKTEVTME
ncbi:putative methyltransferase-domain-containing protein [Crassisporium funariophilum]|nr:putative methyltransferase-domain-containing protein [Crassisporium funariophilum]